MLVYCYTGEVVKGVWLHMYYACVLLYRRGSEGGVALSLLVSVSQHQTSTGYFFLMYLLHNAWYTHTHTHAHTYTCTHIHTMPGTHIHTHAHIHGTHTHMHTHTHIHMHTHTHAHTYTCTHIHTMPGTHTHTHAHTYTHTHIHTYTHTWYSHIHLLCPFLTVYTCTVVILHVLYLYT